MLSGERSVEVNFDKADLCTLGVEIVDGLLDGSADGTHGDDDGLCVLSAIVVEELVVSADALVDLVHVVFGNAYDVVIVGVACLTSLEEHVGVLGGTALYRMLRVEGTSAISVDSVPVEHVSEVFVVPYFDLGDLVGGTETVEEVEERYTALDGGEMGYRTKVHDLLNGVGAEHGVASLATCHDVGVVTENVQGVARDAAGGYMHDGRKELTGDLVHVRDHKKKTLRCSVSRGESTGGEGTVYSTGGAALGLHFLYFYRLAKQVLDALSGHLVCDLGHRRGRGDGIDGSDFRKRIGYGCGSGVAVHRFQFSTH